MQKGADDYLKAQEAKAQADLRARAGAYLKAAFDLGFDLKNPKLDERARADSLPLGRLRFVMTRLKARIDEAKKKHDPVFAAWLAFEPLPAGEFSRRAPSVARALDTEGRGELVQPLARPILRRQPAVVAGRRRGSLRRALQ